MRELKKLLALVLAMLFLFALLAATIAPCHAQVMHIEPPAIEEEETQPSTLRVVWRRTTSALTVYAPSDCYIIIAEYNSDGRMVRLRCTETTDGICVFSDGVEGETVKLFAVNEHGAPVCQAMDLTSFCEWYRG